MRGCSSCTVRTLTTVDGRPLIYVTATYRKLARTPRTGQPPRAEKLWRCAVIRPANGWVKGSGYGTGSPVDNSVLLGRMIGLFHHVTYVYVLYWRLERSELVGSFDLLRYGQVRTGVRSTISGYRGIWLVSGLG